MKNLRQVPIIFFTSFLFVSIYSHGQLLWKVSGNGIKSPSYLFGTIHIIPKDKFSFPSGLIPAFENCGSLVTEINLNQGLKAQIQMASEVLIPGGKTIKDFVDSASYEKLKIYFQDSLRIKKNKFRRYERLRPIFLSAIVAKQQMGKTVSFEQKLTRMAKKKSMKIIGLETIQDQMAAINSIAVKDQAKILIDELSDSSRQMSDMLDVYLKGDINTLDKMIRQTGSGISGFENQLIYSRNGKWIPIIENLIKEDANFIAVGAGHLPGEEGLINLLRLRGYVLESVQ